MNLDKELKEIASGLSLLIVDDDANNCILLQGMLARYFASIDIASDGVEPLQLYRCNEYSLVLTDINMPNMNGEKLISEIMNINCLQEVVAMSGDDNMDMLIALLNSGAGGFIKKPMNINKMHAVLINACRRIHERVLINSYIEQLERDRCLSSSHACAQQKRLLDTSIAHVDTSAVNESSCDDDFEFVIPSGHEHAVHHDASEYLDYFSQLQSDDREELYDIIHDIDSTVVMAFAQSASSAEYIARLGQGLMKFGGVLLRYQVFSDMGTKVIELGQTIQSYIESIVERLSEVEVLIAAFCSVLQKYLDDVWNEESSNPRFYNDSIVNDAASIVEFLTPAKVSNGEVELMFF